MDDKGYTHKHTGTQTLSLSKALRVKLRVEEHRDRAAKCPALLA